MAEEFRKTCGNLGILLAMAAILGAAVRMLGEKEMALTLGAVIALLIVARQHAGRLALAAAVKSD